MTVAAWLLGATLVATAAQAQHDHAADTRSRPVTLDAGLRGVHHPIQTTNVGPQKFFDQGLTLVYAFNHEEAVRSFEKASELDSMSPMPHWGIALPLGPNYNHNLDFLASAAMMTAQFAQASEAADELVKNVAPIIPDMPMAEPFGAKKMYVLSRFAKWDAALALPMPDVRATVATTLFHFGRGVAHASLGAVADAGRERAAYQAAKQRVPSDAMIGYNPASAVFLVCDAVLDARIAAAGHNLDSAIQAWQKAVAAEDALSYDEPADWFYPTRESLGAAYFRARRFEDADRTFREDLERNPGNPRSLFALWQMVGVRGEAG